MDTSKTGKSWIRLVGCINMSILIWYHAKVYQWQEVGKIYTGSILKVIKWLLWFSLKGKLSVCHEVSQGLARTSDASHHNCQWNPVPPHMVLKPLFLCEGCVEAVCPQGPWEEQELRVSMGELGDPSLHRFLLFWSIALELFFHLFIKGHGCASR